MAEELVIEAASREGQGTNAARALRRSGRVPGILYGGAKEAVPVSVDPRSIERVLHSEAGYNAVFTLTIDGKGKNAAMIREWQVEPVKGTLLHVDFLRIAMEKRLKVKVPVEIKGEPVGVKQQGGMLEIVHREVEIECLPADIPDHFIAEVAELTIGKSLRVADLKVDTGKLRLLTNEDEVVAHVIAPRVEEEEKPAEEAVAEAAADAETAEPEVVRKGKAEAEEGAAEGGESADEK
ncbi:MAG: 50S ribosomal protein L25/general stress protein Ctc [Terriglobia bacterium]